MSTNHHPLKLKYKVWIETEQGTSILGEGKWKLLKAIQETGSLKEATEQMGLSYRKTWQNLINIEKKLGFAIIQKTRGGEKGGHTALTRKGNEVVAFFDKLYLEMDPAIKQKFDILLNDLNDIIDDPQL